MTTYLHRFTVKPKHLDAYLPVLEQELALRRHHQISVHRAFAETDAEPKLTLLYSAEPDQLAAYQADPETAALADQARGHVFTNLLVRPVGVEVMTEATPESVAGRIAIMRRYRIVGSWDDFLAVWRRIVPVREQYGFRCLFAVRDQPTDMFTWAFDFAGAWEEFPAAQRPYYHDPARVDLRGVFNFMADYSIHPARQLLL
ncbi:MAG: hypothetical protein Q4G45_13070 [Actinomycetia bacterium]|nr:hypothetical protein [Actinomycetes bacterium]